MLNLWFLPIRLRYKNSYAGWPYDDQACEDDGWDFRQAEVAHGQGRTNELRDNREIVEDVRVDDAERSPEIAKALHDEPGVANDAIHGAEPEYHLLFGV